MVSQTVNRFLSLTLLSIASIAGADEGTARFTMTTNQGVIEIDQYLDKAPISAGNFLRLVEGEHLDGGSFYRVVTYANDNGKPKTEVIQGGLGDDADYRHHGNVPGPLFHQ